MNESEKEDLIRRHTPQLVLYHEISRKTTREKSRDPDYLDESPLPFDYHPRDIRLVLENSGFHTRFRLWGKGKKSDWRKMLDRMEGKKYEKDLDVLPGVQSDKPEIYWEEYAKVVERNKDDYKHRCYARVVPGKDTNDDRLVVQYWYAYFYNDFWNLHEMDWECVMIVFKTDGDEVPKPTVCVGSAHHKGSWLPWEEVDKVDGGTRPVIYVANGSHAAYFHGPRKYVTAPEVVANVARHFQRENRGVSDFTTSWEKGSKPTIEATQIPAPSDWQGEWRWLNQQGRWGSPGEWDFELGDSGPKGPPQAGDKWDRPFRWINDTCDRASSEEGEVPTRLE